MSSLMSTYARLPVAFTHGDGVWVWDSEGKRYLDGLCGLAVTGLGHANPRVTAAIAEQASSLLHVSNLYRIPVQEELAARLCRVTGMDKVFFANSGAEANEAAIKVARLHGAAKEIESPSIVVMDNAFHGRTLATLTATGNRKVQAGFEPLVQGFVRAPYNDLQALREIASNRSDIVAVMLEPIQGEAGIVLPDDDYLGGVRALCDEHGWLMILDEIQSGMARTGAWLACQQCDVRPDVVTLAKGLGNGVPIGACLAHGGAAELMLPGHHGSTFGGNPLSCAAGLAVVEEIESGDLLSNAERAGTALVQGLQQRIGGMDGVREVRGRGLLIAVELDNACPELVTKALERGLLLNVTQGNIIRLLPPLVIEPEQVSEIIDTVSELVGDFVRSQAA